MVASGSAELPQQAASVFSALKEAVYLERYLHKTKLSSLIE